jgi:hypothetical protein
MRLSEDVDVDRLCEDAAVEIERLRAAHPPLSPWSD